jgi:hypothetical protein
MFENIFEDTAPLIESNNEHISLDNMKTLGVDLIDITNSTLFDNSNQPKSETLKSGSTCSSRTSHTNDNDLSDVDEEETKNSENGSYHSNENEVWEDYNSETTIEEESLTLTFPQFPVQLICMEQCENTFDNLIISGEITDDEWFSALMQIIMILISYQKMFSFTHNDLHTNNIMYVSTNKKYIYYIYKKKTYKVPTFGKIYKIIDFGRAIYKFNGKIFCSDSFQTGGDAATQYNTEPYFNNKKPRLDPNPSFDLCRLGCSIFDMIVDDLKCIENVKSPILRIIIDWCMDDKKRNVLYKNNGEERYPDFKLYKMIARTVHNHVPLKVLQNVHFDKYVIDKKKIKKSVSTTIMDIDSMPCY